MLDPAHIPPVAAGELLARFVLFSDHVRKSNRTVKPDAFMPHPLTELSITRHLQASDAELWSDGGRVARSRNRTLYGRADVLMDAFLPQSLAVVAAPIPQNPNHVNATGWPAEKHLQKIKAIEIAKLATYIPAPPQIVAAPASVPAQPVPTAPQTNPVVAAVAIDKRDGKKGWLARAWAAVKLWLRRLCGRK